MQPSVIQVLNEDVSSSKRGNKVDLDAVEQIVTLALESLMWLLLDLENDITWLDTRLLVTLATKLNLMAGLNASVDVNVEHLSLDAGLLSVTLLAAVLLADLLSLSVTVWADSLETLDHWSHLAHHGLHALAITASALLDSTLLSTSAVALGADDGLLQSELGDLSLIDIFQGDLHDVVNGASLRWAAWLSAAESAKWSTATAEELGEEILSVHATSHSWAAVLESGLTILVVDLAFLCIGKNLVCVGDLLELLSGGWVVGVLIWVVLEGHNSVCLLQLLLSAGRRDIERLVELGLLNHVCGCVGWSGGVGVVLPGS